jgi:predicted GIY-YIG superfamily endonuclease
MSVYLLAQRRRPSPARRVYQGVTEDRNPRRRLRGHNSGNTRATRDGVPWELGGEVRGFVSVSQAKAFEQQLRDSRADGPGLSAKLRVCRALLGSPSWRGRGIRLIKMTTQVRSSHQQNFGE